MREACPSGEDLTAYALGEGQGPWRSSMARHVLACRACRGAMDADQRLVQDLRALGAARSVPPASNPQRVPAPRTRRWLAALPPVAAALLVGLVLGLPRRQAPAADVGMVTAPPPKAAVALPARLQHLLETQEPDGGWRGDGDIAGADGRTATALALLAMDHASRAEGVASTTLDSARERARGHLGRQAGPEGARVRRLPAHVQALWLAALCAPVREPSTGGAHPAAHALVDALAQHAQGGLAPSAVPWVAYALERAEACNLPGTARLRDLLPREGLAASTGQGALSWPAWPLGTTDGQPDGVPCSPLRTALELLHDQPPLRGLALGPACRLPLLARAP